MFGFIFLSPLKMQFCVLFSEFKILPPLCAGGHRWAAQVVIAKHVSDQGNNITMVPTRIRFLDNPLLSAWHCGPEIGFGRGGHWCTEKVLDERSRIFFLSLYLCLSRTLSPPSLSLSSLSFSLSLLPPSLLDLLCLRSSGSEYNASTIN